MVNNDTILISSIEQARKLFFELIESPDDPFTQRLEFSERSIVSEVYIERPKADSSISPPYMEAFLILQKEIFQFAALANTGIANASQLTEIDRQSLEICVIVKGGSSENYADLAKQLERCFKAVFNKMTGRQAAAVILGVALILGGTWGWSAWLESQKVLKLEEMKSKGHLQALQSMQFATEQQLKQFQMIMDYLNKQGEIGKKAADIGQNTNRAMLKAASRTDESRINGVVLQSSEAEALRLSSRVPLREFNLIENMRVVDMNTAAEIDQMILMRQDTQDQFRMKLSETLFMSDDRAKLFQALKDRALIKVELAVKEVDGEIKSVSFLRVSPIQ